MPPNTATAKGTDPTLLREVTDTDTAEDSLYVQLGGETGVKALLDVFLRNVGADTSINWMFATADMANLKQQLHDQICAASGGGCTYSGASMLDAHAGMGITSDQFNALAGDLLAALTELGVPYALDGSQPIDPLLIALVGMQTEIVTDPDGTITTFNKIGGYGAVNAVIDEFLANVAADTRINGFFATTDLANLKQLLVEQVCSATGGYCVYTGRSMCEAHDGMGVTSDDFNALVEDLLTALDTLGVPYALDGSEAIDPLLIALVGMEGQVLGTDCP